MKKLSILIAFTLAATIAFGQATRKDLEKAKKNAVDTNIVQTAPTSINLKVEDSNIDILFYILTKGKLDGVSQEDMLKIAVLVEGLKQQATVQLQARSAPKK
jgi:hypothetical protein